MKVLRCTREERGSAVNTEARRSNRLVAANGKLIMVVNNALNIARVGSSPTFPTTQVKICTRCKEEKSIDKFNRKGSGYQYHCRDCSKKILKEDYVNNKDRYLAKTLKNKTLAIKEIKEFKNTLKCMCCDEKETCCLDFHHLDPNKKDFNIGSKSVTGITLETLKKEINKCVVLCSNCHRKVHAGKLKLIVLRSGGIGNISVSETED